MSFLARYRVNMRQIFFSSIKFVILTLVNVKNCDVLIIKTQKNENFEFGSLKKI